MPVHRPELQELLAIARQSLLDMQSHSRFELRLVVHALEIVAREVEQGAAASGVEHAALAQLLGHDGSIDALNRELCERLESGAVAPDDERFLEAMRACVRVRLAIDNPKFEEGHRC